MKLSTTTLLTSLSILSTSVLSKLTADKVTVDYGTIQGIYDSDKNSLQFTIQTTQGGKPFGWFATGTGNQMAGSSMAIFWVNDDGYITKSQRKATGEFQPTVAAVTAAEFDFQTAVTNDNGTTITWTEPMAQGYSPSNAENFIWSHNPGQMPPPQVDATLRYHGITNRGFYNLDLTKPYTDGAALGSSGMASNMGGQVRDLSVMSTRVILVHVILMSISFLGLLPAGALLARYGRTFTSKWFVGHRGIQYFAVCLIIIGLALGISFIQMTGRPHLVNTHEKLGIAIFVLVIVQVLLGELAHYINVKKSMRTGYVHAPLGILLFALAIWQIHEGIPLWQWNPSNGFSIFVYVWAGVIGVAYFAGFALLPRERRQAKERNSEKPSSTGSDEALRS